MIGKQIRVVNSPASHGLTVDLGGEVPDVSCDVGRDGGEFKIGDRPLPAVPKYDDLIFEFAFDLIIIGFGGGARRAVGVRTSSNLAVWTSASGNRHRRTIPFEPSAPTTICARSIPSVVSTFTPP